MIGIGVGLRVQSAEAAAPATHTITITNPGAFGVPPCTITPSPQVLVVAHGANQSVRMVGGVDFYDMLIWWIERLVVDGVAVPAAVGSADFTRTFTNVTTNHTLAVTFTNGA